MTNIADYVEIIRAKQAAENKLEKTDASIQPSGVPGGGDTNVPLQSLLPKGFDGEIEHTIFDIFPISIAPGASQTFESSNDTKTWFVRLDSTASQTGEIYVGPGRGGVGFPIYSDGNAKIPARGPHLTIRNTSALVTLNGLVVALANLNLDYSPGTAGGAGGGPATIADGADVTLGAIADAAVITDAAGTISAKLRGLVKWAFERMPTSLGQKTAANSFPIVMPSDLALMDTGDTIYNSAGVAYTIKQSDISATADGDNTVIAAVAAKKIRIMDLVLSTTGAGLITLKSGANTNGHVRSGADGGGCALSGTAKSPAWINVNVNEAFIVNNPAGVDTYGFCTYIEV